MHSMISYIARRAVLTISAWPAMYILRISLMNLGLGSSAMVCIFLPNRLAIKRLPHQHHLFHCRVKDQSLSFKGSTALLTHTQQFIYETECHGLAPIAG